MANQLDLARQLLWRAADDEAAARALLGTTGVSDAIVGFHAQQAVEKALKAVLAARAVDFPFSHDLGLLMALCEREGIPISPELAGADRLSPYGARLRYGDDEAAMVERETALRWARHAVDWAQRQLASEDS